MKYSADDTPYVYCCTMLSAPSFLMEKDTEFSIWFKSEREKRAFPQKGALADETSEGNIRREHYVSFLLSCPTLSGLL